MGAKETRAQPRIAKLTQRDIEEYEALPLKEQLKAWDSLKRLEAAGEIEPIAGKIEKPE